MDASAQSDCHGLGVGRRPSKTTGVESPATDLHWLTYKLLFRESVQFLTGVVCRGCWWGGSQQVREGVHA